MKVLHVINHLDLAGAERLLADLAPLQRKGGVSVAVVALNLRDTRLAERLRGDGVMVFAGQGSLYSPSQIQFLRGIFREVQPDIVHAHLFPAMLWVALAASGSTRLVTTEHNTWNRRRRWWFREIDRKMYSGYEQIICVSPQVSDAFAEWLPEARARLRVIPNGISLDRFRCATVQGKGSPFQILTVGRLTEQKGIDILLRAVSELPGVEVSIAGDGPLREELETLAKTLGAGERVRFLGACDNVPELMAGVDAYVQSSRWEGFGIAAVEAMASGLPVVVSDVPGLREVVGDAGLTFAAGDSAALAKALGALIVDTAWRESLSRKAKLRAAGFSIERTADLYAALYREVLGGVVPVAWKQEEPHAASPTH
ncbi:MAG: glycosyltransferase [Bryobacteraceae bacterium]